jgi:hypothetical protein
MKQKRFSFCILKVVRSEICRRMKNKQYATTREISKNKNLKISMQVNIQLIKRSKAGCVVRNSYSNFGTDIRLPNIKITSLCQLR